MTQFLRIGAAILLISSCGAKLPPYGGEKESALATATMAVDVGAVTRLLGAGADPNKMVPVNGNRQSPWFLALYLLRPARPEMVPIIKAMLNAGANPNDVWGTMTDVHAPPESLWHRFTHHARSAGTGMFSTFDVLMVNAAPQADVVRALTAAHARPQLAQALLVSSIESGDADVVHVLVDAGVDVNCRPGANTPLLAAIEARDVPMMTYLEEHGAREKP